MRIAQSPRGGGSQTTSHALPCRRSQIPQRNHQHHRVQRRRLEAEFFVERLGIVRQRLHQPPTDAYGLRRLNDAQAWVSRQRLPEDLP